MIFVFKGVFITRLLRALLVFVAETFEVAEIFAYSLRFLYLAVIICMPMSGVFAAAWTMDSGVGNFITKAIFEKGSDVNIVNGYIEYGANDSVTAGIDVNVKSKKLDHFIGFLRLPFKRDDGDGFVASGELGAGYNIKYVKLLLGKGGTVGSKDAFMSYEILAGYDKAFEGRYFNSNLTLGIHLTEKVELETYYFFKKYHEMKPMNDFNCEFLYNIDELNTLGIGAGVEFFEEAKTYNSFVEYRRKFFSNM